MRQFLQVLSLVAGSCITGCTSSDWVKFALDDQVAVQVPSYPTGIDLSTTSLANRLVHPLAFSIRDASGEYQIIRVDISADVPKDALLGKTGHQLYYDTAVRGVIKNGQGVLLERSEFTTAAGQGVELKYRIIHQSTRRPVLMYRRFLLLGRLAYTFGFTPPDERDSTGITSEKQRNQFFNSITAKPVVISHDRAN
jgi:hypothetical protein